MKDNSGSAFPHVNETYMVTGMTKRELIAMHLLSGLLAGQHAVNYEGKESRTSVAIAFSARHHADALLAELAKE